MLHKLLTLMRKTNCCGMCILKIKNEMIGHAVDAVVTQEDEEEAALEEEALNIEELIDDFGGNLVYADE